MSNNNWAWKNKLENKGLAQLNYNFFLQDPETRGLTESSYENSLYYTEEYYKEHKPADRDTIFVFDNKTSVESALGYILAGRKVCILNFASYKHPGGMYMEGSMAQEESLCHASNLYNILERFTPFYEYNNHNLNKALYTNRAIYTHNVCFKAHPPFHYATADVLTCAAPNASAYFRYNNDFDLYMKTLYSRIIFIRDVLADHKNVEVFIAGAYGCGVFGNNPQYVRDAFISVFKNSDYIKDKLIVFAVPGDDSNTQVFSNIDTTKEDCWYDQIVNERKEWNQGV